MQKSMFFECNSTINKVSNLISKGNIINQAGANNRASKSNWNSIIRSMHTQNAENGCVCVYFLNASILERAKL